MPELRDYQRTAVDFLHRKGSAALFLDMGLGKTCIALHALTPAHLPVLVVAPKRVAEEVWPEEIPKWRPDLTFALAAGTPKQRAAAFAEEADITIIGRDATFKDALPHAARYRTLILDELSGFKTRGVRWKTARRIIKTGDPYVWGLTGTPSPNGLLDLWAQLLLIDKGVALGNTLSYYRGQYFTPGKRIPNGAIIEWNLQPGAEALIHRRLERVCLSMSSEGRVDLPPVTVNDITVPLPPRVMDLYQKLKADLQVDMELFGGSTGDAANTAVLSTMLRQVSAGFLYDQDELGTRTGTYTILHEEKIKALREIIDGTGSPILVAYQFRAELERFQKAFPSAETINTIGVQKRWNAGEIPILLAHPAAAGHGLNLQFGGHTLVWASLTWSLEEYQQFNKRLHRSGAERPIMQHRLMSPRTIDLSQDAALSGKKTVQQALLDHLKDNT